MLFYQPTSFASNNSKMSHTQGRRGGRNHKTTECDLNTRQKIQFLWNCSLFPWPFWAWMKSALPSLWLPPLSYNTGLLDLYINSDIPQHEHDSLNELCCQQPSLLSHLGMQLTMNLMIAGNSFSSNYGLCGIFFKKTLSTSLLRSQHNLSEL